MFFLYPHSVIRDELIEELLRNEYEVYVLDHHAAALKAIRVYNDAILFINIDEGMSEHSWERYIRRVMENPDTENVRIGVLSYNEDRRLARKYLIDMMVPCGFVTLRIGIKESMRIVLKTLEASEAKGRRQFLRAKTPSQAHVNIEVENRIHSGTVQDIGLAGMQCRFGERLPGQIEQAPSEFRLNLKGMSCTVSGKVESIESGSADYLVMFGGLSPESQDKIRWFIRRSLQEEVERVAGL